ncbi:MAG: TIGR04283 family arsenosugar biosynthesis glycosyltransferase [Pricia sp.]
MTTIIIPAHNERQNLETLLPRLEVLRQGFGVEIILALSADTCDGSEQMALADDIDVFRCKKKGRAMQMNAAAQRAKGSILVFLHADVKPPESFLQDITNAIASGYEAGFFSYRFDKKSFFLQINAAFTGKDGIFTGGGDQCLFIKKEVFDTLGGFDEQQVLMEDFEFFKRMKKHRVNYTIIQNDLIVSARKYKNNSYVRINLTNFLLVILFKLGYPAPKLKTLHDRLIKTPYSD